MEAGSSIFSSPFLTGSSWMTLPLAPVTVTVSVRVGSNMAKPATDTPASMGMTTCAGWPGCTWPVKTCENCASTGAPEAKPASEAAAGGSAWGENSAGLFRSSGRTNPSKICSENVILECRILTSDRASWTPATLSFDTTLSEGTGVQGELTGSISGTPAMAKKETPWRWVSCGLSTWRA
jgi:hypothetical protein